MAQFPDPTFRTATEADVERLLEIHFAAYPNPRGIDERRRNFLSNPFGSIESLTVALFGGDIVAHAFCFPFEASFGGRRVGVGGIASVAVAPEARGRGIGRALMKRLHGISDMRGDAITMLYPFRQGFYASLDYAPVSSRKRLAFHPRAIPRAWGGSRLVRRAKGEDRPHIEALHRALVARENGIIARTSAYWDRLFARDRRHHFVVDDGYVAFSLEQEEAHAPTTLIVDELVASNDEARRTLFGAIATMADQVAEVVIELRADDPIDQVLLDADRSRFGTEDVEHALGEIVAGPMVRIEDVHRAIEARGYAAGEAVFDVVLDDEIAMAVAIEDGRATVSSARGGAVLRASRATLAAIFYGGLRAVDAARLGLLDAQPGLLERLDAVAALSPLAPFDAF